MHLECSLVSLLFIILILSSVVMSDLGSSLSEKGLSDTIVLWKGDKWLLALTDDENVAETGGEGVAIGVLDLDNLVGTWMVLNVHEDTDTTNIVTTLDEDLSAILEFDNSINFASLEVEL